MKRTLTLHFYGYDAIEHITVHQFADDEDLKIEITRNDEDDQDEGDEFDNTPDPWKPKGEFDNIDPEIFKPEIGSNEAPLPEGGAPKAGRKPATRGRGELAFPGATTPQKVIIRPAKTIGPVNGEHDPLFGEDEAV